MREWEPERQGGGGWGGWGVIRFPSLSSFSSLFLWEGGLGMDGWWKFGAGRLGVGLELEAVVLGVCHALRSASRLAACRRVGTV